MRPQDTIEGKLEKRTKGVFAPAGGKRLVCFIDDLNMPQKSKFGFIPPLELLKLWVDNGFWYGLPLGFCAARVWFTRLRLCAALAALSVTSGQPVPRRAHVGV